MAPWHEYDQEENHVRKNLARSVAAIFRGSPTGHGNIIGTGFLKDPMTVVTANHLFATVEDFSPFCCVFGFGSESEMRIYGINAVDRTGHDAAEVTLDRPVHGRSPLQVNASGQINETDQMFVIGYPSRRPCNISDDCGVTQNGEESFEIDLLPEDGASGAPVFNAATSKIEGILLSGEQRASCEKTSVFC